MSYPFRRFLTLPLVAFDSVRMGMQNNPRTGNNAMMMSSFFMILLLGNGADKLTTRGGVGSKYEQYRRANRFYVPYFAADYSFRHPQIKQ